MSVISYTLDDVIPLLVCGSIEFQYLSFSVRMMPHYEYAH